jgi:hypothetical protein
MMTLILAAVSVGRAGTVRTAAAAEPPSPSGSGPVAIAGAAATPWIVKGDGPLLVETLLSLKNSGNPVRLWTRIVVPGKPARIEALGEVAAGANSVTVRHAELAADGEKIEFSVFDNNKCGGQALAAAAFPLAKARHWTIYVNHDMHQDVGYTDYQEDLKRRIWPGFLDLTFKHIADTADWPDAARARRGIESSMMLYDSALLARNADWVETFKQHLRDGRISYSATFGNLAQENMSAEEFVRSSYYSLRHLRDMFGGGCNRIAGMNDNDSLVRSAVDVLAGAGVKYYMFQVNGTECAWGAPDGNRLYYVEGFNPANRLLVFDDGIYVQNRFGLGEKVDRKQIDRTLNWLQGQRAYPYDAYLTEFTWATDNRPTLFSVYEAVKTVNAWGYEWPKFVVALPERFFEHIESRFADRVPVYRKHVENWWNYGAGSTAYETSVHKRTQDTLAAAEMLATFACVADPRGAYPCEDLATAWKNMVLYAEHTWGNDRSEVDRQWFWKRNTALQAEVAAEKVLRDSMAALGARMATDGPTLIVWNFCPWQRTDVVRLAEGLLPKGAGLADPVTGKPAPLQPAGAESVFLASDVPALGYKAYRIGGAGDSGAGPGGGQGLIATADGLENRFFRVRFDANGNVISILDKERGGRELVDPDCPYRLNQFLYRFETKQDFTVEKAKLSTTVGPVMATMTAEGGCFGVDSMKRTVVLYRDLPRIDFVNELVKSPSGFGEKGKGWPKEEGYFVFPLRVPDFLLRHELPTGTLRPLVDPNPGEPEQAVRSSTDHYTVNRWVDVSNQRDFGVTLAPLDAPLMMYGERQARKFEVKYKAKKPWLYSYVVNNLWVTNFQKTQPGRLVFRYALKPRDGGDWLAGGAHRLGMEASSPLRAARIAGKQTGSPDFARPAASLLPIDKPNIVLIAAKLAEANGEGVILRFNEIEGKETNFTVDLARLGPRAVTSADLVENDLAPVTLAGSKAALRIPGYGFVTLRVAFGDPPAVVSNLKATADAYGALVSWDAAAGATHYEVFRGADGASAPQAGHYLATVSVNHFLDRQVTTGVKGRYHYRVRAAGAGRKGAFSPAAAATLGAIGDTTPPAAPAFSAKALRFDKVSLTWDQPADNVAVKGYKLFRDGVALADLPVVYQSWIDLRTDPDKEYEYTIRAYDDAGNLSEPAAARVGTHGFVVPPGTLPASALEAVAATKPVRKPSAHKPGNVAPRATVTVSSEFSADYAGKHVTDGICGEHDHGEWASKGEPKPWLRLEWKEPVAIGKVVIYDRPNSSDHAKAGRLIFSDGDPVPVADIANDGSPRTVTFAARKVTWLRFEVTESSGSNIGLAEIEIFGGK